LKSVTPIRIEVLEEPLELDVVLAHVLQLTLLPLQGRRVVLRLISVLCSRLRLQLHNLLSQALGGTDLLGNQSSRLVHHGLEATRAANTNVCLSRTTASKLVVDIDNLSGDVIVGDAEDPLTGVTPLILALVEEEREGALGIVVLHLLRGERKTQHRRQRSTDVGGRVGAVSNAHHGWTRKPLDRSFIPVDDCTLDSMGLEKTEDVRGSIAAGYGSGGIGMDRDPHDDGSEDGLPVFIGGGEAHRHERRETNATFLFLQQGDYCRSNRAAPDGGEGCIKRSLDGLLRKSRVSILGDNEGIRFEI